jgi:hypothetical protein
VSEHRETDARPADELPAFMRPIARGGTATPPNESTSLISEHDLPSGSGRSPRTTPGSSRRRSPTRR